MTPLPISNLRHVLPVFVDILLVLDELGTELLLQDEARFTRLQQAVAGVEAIQIIEHSHVERRRDRTLFLVATGMKVVVARAKIGQAVD